MGETILISYSWNNKTPDSWDNEELEAKDNEEHQAWVIKLATDLKENGVNVILDKWHLKLGESMTHFMERSVTNSDRVLCILTPAYKEKCDDRKNGAGYEASIITSELLQNILTNKFIPVLRTGDWNESSPVFLKGRSGIDMRNDDEYEKKLAELVKGLS